MLPRWLERFYGHDLSLYELEVLSIQHIPRAEMQGEAALLNTKWFDYTRIHPMKATYYFVDCYDKAYGEFMRRALDMNKRHMSSFKGKDFLKHRERMSYWNLRRMCDSFGVRYDFFLREAMNWCINQGWIYPPRPSHILKNEAMITDVMILWEEELANSLQVPKDDWFRTQRFAGCSNQLRFEEFVVNQIKMRRLPQYSLSASLYIYDTLRVERAIQEFGADMVGESIKVSALPD